MANDDALRIFDTRFHNPSIFDVRQATNASELLDFCVPANSYFPPAALLARIREELPDILKYYPDYSPVHQANIGRLIGLAPEHIVPANGVTELITQLCLNAQGPILTDTPTFGRWTDLPQQHGVPIHFIERCKDRDFGLTVDEIVAQAKVTGCGTFVLCNPSNPTGACSSLADVESLLDQLQHLALVIIDESFIDFASVPSAEKAVLRFPNAIVVKSMGKALGWHGIRLGYGVANAALAERLRARTPYWNINGLAACVLQEVNRFEPEYRTSFTKVAADREHLYRSLCELPGLKPYPSETNFVYVELLGGRSGRALRDELVRDHGIFVRECSNKVGSSQHYLRLVARKRPDVDRLIAALRQVLRIPVAPVA